MLNLTSKRFFLNHRWRHFKFNSISRWKNKFIVSQRFTKFVEFYSFSNTGEFSPFASRGKETLFDATTVYGKLRDQKKKENILERQPHFRHPARWKTN